MRPVGRDWLVGGDLPSAYLATCDTSQGCAALKTPIYCTYGARGRGVLYNG